MKWWGKGTYHSHPLANGDHLKKVIASLGGHTPFQTDPFEIQHDLSCQHFFHIFARVLTKRNRDLPANKVISWFLPPKKRGCHSQGWAF